MANFFPKSLHVLPKNGSLDTNLNYDVSDRLNISTTEQIHPCAASNSPSSNMIGNIPHPQLSIPFFDIDGSTEGANPWGNFDDRKDSIRDTLGEYGDRNDYFRFSVSNRTNADFSLQASNSGVELELFDAQGNFLARSQSTGSQTDGLVRILSAGEYYLRVYTNKPFFKTDYNLMFNGVSLSQQIRLESDDVNLFRYDENGRTDENDNQPGSFAGIEAGKETVIVIHGWRNSDRSGTIQDLLQEVTKSNVQVLALDWGSIAEARIDQGFVPVETATWIAPIARWLSGQLGKIGVNPNQLTIIGHSLGSYLSAETSSLLGRVKNLVALDPAAYPPQQEYDIDRENGGVQAPKNFCDAANKSIAFVIADGLNNGTFGLLGNNDKAATADNSFLIKLEPGAKQTVTDIEAHGAVVYGFANILERKLLILPNLSLPEYQRDRYNNWGFTDSDFLQSSDRLQHEGVLTLEWTGANTDKEGNFWRVKKLVTVIDGSGQEQEIWT